MNWVDAQTRLLIDANLRCRFRSNPDSVAHELAIGDSEKRLFVSLDPAELEAQAESLIRKRFHEVQQRLPKTCDGMGEHRLNVFRRYARQHWPTGHERHHTDAVEFGAYLQGLRTGLLFVPEWNRERFTLSRKRWCVNLLRPNGNWVTRRFGIELLFRFPSIIRQFHLTLALRIPERRRKPAAPRLAATPPPAY